MPGQLRTPPDHLVHLVQLAEEVRIAKLKLSGLQDPLLMEFLPGANRVAMEVADLLDKLLQECQG